MPKKRTFVLGFFLLSAIAVSPGLAESAPSKTQDNYLSAVASSALMRWKTPSPIRVFIKSGESVKFYRPEFKDSLLRAFEKWSSVSNSKISFAYVESEEEAQIIVSWTSDLKAPELSGEAGVAKTHYADGIDKAEILLLTIDPNNQEPIGKNYLYCVCLHEIGHALGLQGHSPYPDDIMAASLAVQNDLSRRDINTIIALYERDENADEIPMTDEYGRPLSQAERGLRLARSGSALAMAGKYEKAVERLNQALEIDPANALARKNISACANNLAGTEGQSQEHSLNLLHMALYWDPKNLPAMDNLNYILRKRGLDPTSFNARVLMAESCLKLNDLKGAVVEYQLALAIKNDEAVRVKLNSLLAGCKSPPTKN